MRRLKTGTVLRASIIAALICLLLAALLGLGGLGLPRTPWSLLPLGLAAWFGVDAWRAWRWSRKPD